MEIVRVIYYRHAEGWSAESPDVERWYAAGETFAEVKKLAIDGVQFALEREVEVQHFVPAGEQVAA